MTDQQNHNPQKTIREQVLDRIHAGEVRKRPRIYFALRIIAIVVVSVLLLFTSALVISFILFSLHESGEQFLLGFGLQGILVFLQLFPWIPALLTGALIFLLEWLLRDFSIGYRWPLINIFLAIIGASVVLGTLITLTPLHAALLGRAQEDRLPIMGGAYNHIFDPHDDHGMSRGIVTSVATSSFQIQHDDRDHDGDDGTFTIAIPQGSGLPIPRVGDYVLVFGNPAGNSMMARNIRVLPTPPPGQMPDRPPHP